MSLCPAGCGATVRYIRMQSGKLNPVEPYANEDVGNIVVERGVGRQLGTGEATEARAAGYALYLSHLAVCPEAREQERERKSQQAAEQVVRVIERRGRRFGVVDGGAA